VDYVDVLVVGGSVAGLQAALTLGRARRCVVLVDDGQPRNQSARHVPNFLGQAGPAPADLLAGARSMLEPYEVCLVQDRVEHVEIDGRTPAFRVRAATGSYWSARSIVLATGVRDELPDVPGLATCGESRWWPAHTATDGRSAIDRSHSSGCEGCRAGRSPARYC
jgi:thioredoxin reductase